METFLKFLGWAMLVVAVVFGIWHGSSNGDLDIEDDLLGWFAGVTPWVDDIEYDVKYSRVSCILPISTREEFLRVSGKDAFWEIEVGVRWGRCQVSEDIRVDLKCVGDDKVPCSSGQIARFRRKSREQDSTGWTWYVPETRIAIVPSRKLEIVAEDRIGIYGREGDQLIVAFID